MRRHVEELQADDLAKLTTRRKGKLLVFDVGARRAWAIWRCISTRRSRWRRKLIFSKYVHEHLLQHARDVERLRHYVCPKCGTPVGNREVAMKRLNDWLRGRPPQPEATGSFSLRKKKEETPSIICVGCEQRVPLWDEMEQCFASPEIQQRCATCRRSPPSS